ncbi:hypothetical protein N7474_005702 [Penicillium riverlandense]|uniref:uncharacterized protein n=1 Tax=Penicillium riverlandense TaxID=1903569 RepID=UPI0025483DB5|nr:uncharacterized protein N7474_005702 [Penicillium riverlandense]KAJ5820111.1 hypothetical protein N7474_005702 [Penicillium riverlandense]
MGGHDREWEVTSVLPNVVHNDSPPPCLPSISFSLPLTPLSPPTIMVSSSCPHNRPSFIDTLQANLPNLRRLFVEARTEAEENEYSRTAFYNLVLFISSIAVFSLAAQRMSGPKASR